MKANPQTSHHDCDPQALKLAMSLVSNPTMGKDLEEIEAAQALYKVYSSLYYGFKVLITNFANDRQYMAVRDQLPPNPGNSAPAELAAYKEARKRLIYAPVKVAVQQYMDATLQSAGSEADFLKDFSAGSEETMRALIERLLDSAVERYWLELTVAPDSEKKQPEMIRVKVEDGESVELTEVEHRQNMRQCLLRLNEAELANKRQMNAKTGHSEKHIDTVVGRGGYVGKPGANDYLVTEDTLGTYCVLSLDFNTWEWECLARVRSQQSSFTYADAQRKAAAPGVLLRAVRDTPVEFPAGQVGRLQDLRPALFKALQIPHIQPRAGEPPIMAKFADTKLIEETTYWESLQKLFEQHQQQYQAVKWQTASGIDSVEALTAN